MISSSGQVLFERATCSSLGKVVIVSTLGPYESSMDKLK